MIDRNKLSFRLFALQEQSISDVKKDPETQEKVLSEWSEFRMREAERDLSGDRRRGNSVSS